MPVKAAAKSFIDVKKAKETIKVLKKYVACVAEEKVELGKQLPLDSTESEKVIVDVDFKRTPTNNSTFINVIGPLPHPFNFESDEISICLIVKDPEPKKALKDRELDLENTRDVYKQLLIDAGFNDDFLTNRLVIMPMREVLTEYREHEAKSKLSKAYDVFLADKKLMANKFSTLKSFLGNHFWNQNKKVPLPVDLSLTGTELKSEIVRQLDSTTLYVNGRGSTTSVTIGLVGQTAPALAYNLVFVLKRVHDIFGENVAALKIHSSSSEPFPFFVDLASPNEVLAQHAAPRTKLADKIQPAVDEFSLFDDMQVKVEGPGKVSLLDVVNDDEEDGEEVNKKKGDPFVKQVKDKWVKKTSLKRKKAPVMFPGKVLRSRRIHEVSDD